MHNILLLDSVLFGTISAALRIAMNRVACMVTLISSFYHQQPSIATLSIWADTFLSAQRLYLI